MNLSPRLFNKDKYQVQIHMSDTLILSENLATKFYVIEMSKLKATLLHHNTL